MVQSNKYIIGAGLNGLIATYYLKDYILIDKRENVGGQFNNSFSLGPRFIHYTKEFETLLNELKIPYTIKTARIGYLYKGKVYERLNNRMKEEYSLKTRNSKSDNSFLNSGKSSFEYLDFSMKKFISTIFSKIKNRFLDEYVTKITIKNGLLNIETNTKDLLADKIISTVHYRVFCNLIGEQYKVKSNNIYFYLCQRTKYDYDGYEFIYVIDKDNIINRISYNKNTTVIETISPAIITEKKVLKEQVLKDYKITNNNKTKKLKNIYFLGRYASLDNSKRIDSVFEDIKNVK